MLSLLFALIQGLLYLLTPFAALRLQDRVPLLKTLGPVFVCYGVGIVVGNLPGFSTDPTVADIAMSGSVLLAIPLLLFPTDFLKWMRLSVPTILASVAAVFSVVAVGTVLRFVFAPFLEGSADLAAMMIATFTGGMPNMVSVQHGLGVSQEFFDLALLSDTIIGGLYFLFLVSAAGRVYGQFFPAYEAAEGNTPSAAELDEARQYEAAPTTSPTPGFTPKQVGQALGLSALVAAVSAAIGFGVFSEDFAPAAIILGITTLGLAASFAPAVRSLPATHETGQYLLYIFCVAAGMSADLSKMAEASVSVMLFIGLLMGGTIVLHGVICRFFGIDRDTVLIVSVATIYGPPFVGPVAAAIDNRDAEVSGMLVGALGLAVGNYLGLFMGWLL